MDPVTIAAVITAGTEIAQLTAKLIASAGEDAEQALTDMRAELDKLHQLLDPGGTLEQALAVHDANLDSAIAAEKAKKP